MSSPSSSSIASSSNGRLDTSRPQSVLAHQERPADEALPPNRRRSLRSSSLQQRRDVLPSTSPNSSRSASAEMSYSERLPQTQPRLRGDMGPPSTPSALDKGPQPPRHWNRERRLSEGSVAPFLQQRDGSNPSPSSQNQPGHQRRGSLNSSSIPFPVSQGGIYTPTMTFGDDRTRRHTLPPLDTRPNTQAHSGLGLDTPASSSTSCASRSPMISTTASSPALSYGKEHHGQHYNNRNNKNGGKRRNNPHSQKRAARYKAGIVKKNYTRQQQQHQAAGSTRSEPSPMDVDESIPVSGKPTVDSYTNLSAPDLDHAKDLVLDLLGWGVEPEYLLASGVSSQLIHRVFTDLRLRLPKDFVAPLSEASMSSDHIAS